MGTITISNTHDFEAHGLKKHIATITMSSSYATGGDSFPDFKNYFGFRNILYANMAPAGGYTFEVDLANNKIKAYSGASEVTNGTNLSTVSAKITIEGV